MDTPLYNTLRTLAASDIARFHMPGHKGQPIFDDFATVFPLDFTETWGTGNLYTDEGPIRLAERLAARYYGAADCCFLTGGSSQGVLSMLGAAAGAGGTVLLDRGCHQSALHACALLDLRPRFVYPQTLEPPGVPGKFLPSAVARALDADPSIRAFLTVSPTYHGVIRDLRALADICHKREVLLLVDGAHGAHFPAVGLPSPIACGADLATLSAHKTLASLGQGAYLLSAHPQLHTALRENTRLFGTSSPSYPILASLDLARAKLAEGDDYARCAARAAQLRREIAQNTIFSVLDDRIGPAADPCRLAVCTAGTALSGHALAEQLYREYAVACEMADSRSIVCILTPYDPPAHWDRLLHGLTEISRRTSAAPMPPAAPALPQAKQVLTPRQALFAPCRLAAPDQAVGQVCARPVTPYPPGIPLLWPGEEIEAKHIEFLTAQCYNDTVDTIAICSDQP